MTDDIIQKLQDVFRDFFGNKELIISSETVREDIGEWDSVLHIQLIFEVESAFDVMFEAEDIPALVTVKQIISKLEELGAR